MKSKKLTNKDKAALIRLDREIASVQKDANAIVRQRDALQSKRDRIQGKILNEYLGRHFVEDAGGFNRYHTVVNIQGTAIKVNFFDQLTPKTTATFYHEYYTNEKSIKGFKEINSIQYDNAFSDMAAELKRRLKNKVDRI